MKFTAVFLDLLLALLALSFSSVYATDVKKTFDGTSARCQLEADIGNSAFRLKLHSEKQAGSSRELFFEINFLKCQAINQDLVLTSALGDEILFQRSILPDGKDGTIERKILSFSLTAFTESGKLLDKVSISDLSQSSARVKITVDESVLDKNEMILINGLGVEAAKLSGAPEDSASIREYISGTYSIRLD